MDKEAYNELRRIPKAMEYGTERKKAAHTAFKKVKQMNKRRQQDEALQQLGKAKSIWKPFPQQLKIDGKATCDRKLWIPAGARFQHDRYVDPGETEEKRHIRYITWRTKALFEKRYRRPRNTPEYFTIIQSLAGMKDEKATPYGSPPVELFKNLPFCVKKDLAKWIITYYNDLSMTKPESWNILQYVGIPKDEGIPSFEGIRWIGKTASGQKWFMRCVIHQVEAELEESPVITIGFKKKAMIEDISGVLLEIMHHHHKWGQKESLYWILGC